MFGWIIYGRYFGVESGVDKQFFLKIREEEFEKLCFFDVFGIVDIGIKQDGLVYKEFLQ